METFQIENILYNLSLEEASNSQEEAPGSFETLNMLTELEPRGRATGTLNHQTTSVTGWNGCKVDVSNV